MRNAKRLNAIVVVWIAILAMAACLTGCKDDGSAETNSVKVPTDAKQDPNAPGVPGPGGASASGVDRNAALPK